MKQKNINKVLSSNSQIVKEAIYQASQGKLEDWIIAYLTNIDKNPGLVEGLRKQKRWWVGPQDYQVKKLIKTCGPEKNIDFPETKGRWKSRIKEMVKGITSEWSVPPIITEYKSESLLIRDGNHRQEALLKTGVQKYPTIAWFNTLNDLIKACEIQTHTFFLTSTSGSGKSTIVKSIRKFLPFVEAHDFDEDGVPEGAMKNGVWKEPIIG